MVAPNVGMLMNLMEAIDPANTTLQHVSRMHGTKWYGNRPGHFNTPATEDDPRHLPASYYYDQRDDISDRQRGKSGPGQRPDLMRVVGSQQAIQ